MLYRTPLPAHPIPSIGVIYALGHVRGLYPLDVGYFTILCSAELRRRRSKRSRPIIAQQLIPYWEGEWMSWQLRSRSVLAILLAVSFLSNPVLLLPASAASTPAPEELAAS